MADVARILFDRLRANGLTPAQAAGLVGNVRMESSFNTGARNQGDGRDGSDSIGLAQWNGPRAQALQQFAAMRGADWRDPAAQADFVVQELNTTERRAKEAILAANDPQAAGLAAIGYFRPAGFTWDNPAGGHNSAARVAEATRYASEFGGLPTPAGVASTNTPVTMPDLTAPPAPEAAQTVPQQADPVDNTLGNALKAFVTGLQTPKQTPATQSPQRPTMPNIRQQAKPAQMAERGHFDPRKANLGSILGALA